MKRAKVARLGKNQGALFILAPQVIALVAACIVYDPFHLIGNDPRTGETGFATTSVWLWFIGSGILGLTLAYGISQSRRRSRVETEMTEQATKDLYQREENDRRQKEQP
jgi:hypothetical protein